MNLSRLGCDTSGISQASFIFIWCVSSVRQLCSPNFCFAHRQRNMEIFKTRKITKDTSCSASFFETLCTPEWQILTPAGASLIIVCHGPLELDTFALLAACASNSKLYPTAWTSFPPRSLLHCRFSTWSSAGIRIQTRWRLFWGQNGLQQKCYRRHERTSNHLLQSHTLVSAGYQWQSKNISRYKTDASTRKPLFSKYLKKIRNAYMARTMCINVWNSTMCGGMDFLVFVITVPQKKKIQRAICPEWSGQTATQSKECSCFPTSHISERQHPYSAFRAVNYRLCEMTRCSMFPLAKVHKSASPGLTSWPVRRRKNCFGHHHEALELFCPRFGDSLECCLSFESWLCRIPQESLNGS